MARMGDLAILRKTLRDLRWHTVGFGVGLGITAALILAIYPSYSDALEGVELPEFYESLFGEGVADLSNPRNFIQIEYFSWAPILLAVFAIIAGTGALGGEESAGTLELLLAQPVSRRKVLLQKLAGVTLATVLIHGLAASAFLLVAPLVDLKGEVGGFELAAATFSSLPFTFSCAALSMFVATLTPTRALAAGLMTAETVAIYLASVFADLVSGLEWLRYLSPIYYSDAQAVLTEGVMWWHQALLAGSGIALVALAVFAFDRREIGTGRSPLARWLPRRSRRRRDTAAEESERREARART